MSRLERNSRRRRPVRRRGVLLGALLVSTLGATGCRAEQRAEELTEGSVEALEQKAQTDQLSDISHDAAEGALRGLSTATLELARDRRLERTLHEVGLALQADGMRQAMHAVSRDVAGGAVQAVQEDVIDLLRSPAFREALRQVGREVAIGVVSGARHEAQDAVRSGRFRLTLRQVSRDVADGVITGSRDELVRTLQSPEVREAARQLSRDISAGAMAGVPRGAWIGTALLGVAIGVVGTLLVAGLLRRRRRSREQHERERRVERAPERPRQRVRR